MATVLIPGFSLLPAMWEAVDVDAHAIRIPTAPDWPRTVAKVADHGPGVFCGYSLGGRLALGVALDHPERVERLVLVSASPGVDEAERAARRASDEKWAKLAELSPARFFDDWLSQPILAGSSWRNRISDGATLAHQLRVLGQGAMPSYWERLTELTMPVAIVVGVQDPKYVAIASRMASQIANCEVHVIADAGHPVVAQRPGEIARILTQA